MRYNDFPHTVDIAVGPLEPFQPPADRQIEPRVVIVQSLLVDVCLIGVSLLAGLLFSNAVSAIDVSGIDRVGLLKPPQWLIFFACALPAVMCLFTDMLSSISNPAVLPFARSRNAAKALYAKRFHSLLLAFYFTAILVALCWSAFSMLLVSKLFVSAVFAIALYALGQSIPSQRLSFALSGILFIVVLVATQAFIVMKLEANAERANEVLNGLDAPVEEESIDESVFESRGE